MLISFWVAHLTTLTVRLSSFLSPPIFVGYDYHTELQPAVITKRHMLNVAQLQLLGK